MLCLRSDSGRGVGLQSGGETVRIGNDERRGVYTAHSSVSKVGVVEPPR